MAQQPDDAYDEIIDALRERGPVYTRPGKPAEVFDRLGIARPKRPVQVIQTLVATGAIQMNPENDDPNADPRRPAKELCERYRVR